VGMRSHRFPKAVVVITGNPDQNPFYTNISKYSEEKVGRVQDPEVDEFSCV